MDAPIAFSLRSLLAAASPLACLLLASSVALAQTAAPKPPAKGAAAEAKPREGSLGKGKSGGPVLTREQLRQCMTEQERLRVETADVVAAQRALDADKAELTRLAEALKTQLETLDRSSQQAVDGYNAEATRRTKMVESYQAAAPLFNDRVDKLDAAKETWTKDCADRRYREDDFDLIKAGK